MNNVNNTSIISTEAAFANECYQYSVILYKIIFALSLSLSLSLFLKKLSLFHLFGVVKSVPVHILLMHKII